MNRLLVAFWLAALMRQSVTTQQTGLSVRQRLGDEDEIREVVFRRLFLDYCGGRSAPKFVMVNVGDYAALKDPSQQLLEQLRHSLPVPIRKASTLSEDVAYLDQIPGDKSTQAAGVELAVRQIHWRDRNHAFVHAEYGKNAMFILAPVYHVERAGDSWRLTGVGTESKHDTCQVRGRSGRHTYEISLAKRPFRPQDHRITGRRGEYKIDGKEAIGADGNVPREELYRFEVRVDGKLWPIPSRLWRDCYEADLETDHRKNTPRHSRPPRSDEDVWERDDANLSAWFSRDGSRLAVLMSGSDGAGGYVVVWYLRSDGYDSRTVFGPP